MNGVVEPVAYLVVGLFAIGMAASFLAVDPRSPTSRSLSLFWVMNGFASILNLPSAAGLWVGAAAWQRVYSSIEVLAMLSAYEWILRVGRTEASLDRCGHGRDWLLRGAQALAVVYGGVGILMPDLRSEVWWTSFRSSLFATPAFYAFAIPFNVSVGLAGARIIQLVRAELDRAEKARLLTMLVAAPAWTTVFFVPDRWRPLTTALGEVVFLFGALRYHVLQGERGQFLSRFLSPEVARMVRERGMASTMQQSRLEISVVACDLRGFTAFAESAAPEDVMKLLRDYYGSVGEAVTAHGGSVKDFAGDGMLALVGAPLPTPDHPERAIRMALAMRERGDEVVGRWRRLGVELGVGLGVASGFVTVGTIGGAGRLEYAAVGPAVNLASRLCGRAGPGEILADSRIAGLATERLPEFRFVPLGTAELKGFARPVPVFAVTSATPRVAARGGAA